MNIPLIQNADVQQINAALIAIKNAIEVLEEKIKELASASASSSASNP